MDRVRALRPSGEEGSFLIEVVVTAALLLTMSLGLLMALDAANAKSAEARLRAQALSVAQSEMDLLRTQRYNDLRALAPAARTVDSAGRQFTVTRTLAPARQTNAPGGCTVRRSRDALEATVSVTWASMGSRAPVRLTSLISAPVGAGGGLVATVRGADGRAIDGLPIGLTGPGGTTAATDAAGCARWDNLAGQTTYELAFSRAAWVDQQGNERVTRPITVAPEAMNTTAFAYDEAGAVQLRFRTRRRDPVTGVVGPVVAQPPLVAFDNASVDPVVRQLSWADPAVQAANTTAVGRPVGGLFPFPATGYVVFAGACPGAMPPSGPHMPEVLAPRGRVATASGAAYTVQLPSLDLRVTNGGAPLPAGTTLTTTSCGTTWGTTPRPVAADGTLADPAMPYGRVGLCVSAPSADGTVARERQAWAEVDVTSFGDPPTTTLDLATGAACPA